MLAQKSAPTGQPAPAVCLLKVKAEFQLPRLKKKGAALRIQDSIQHWLRSLTDL